MIWRIDALEHDAFVSSNSRLFEPIVHFAGTGDGIEMFKFYERKMFRRSECLGQTFPPRKQRFIDQKIAIDRKRIEDDVREWNVSQEVCVDLLARKARLEGAEGQGAAIALRDDFTIENHALRLRA